MNLVDWKASLVKKKVKCWVADVQKLLHSCIMKMESPLSDSDVFFLNYNTWRQINIQQRNMHLSHVSSTLMDNDVFVNKAVPQIVLNCISVHMS